MKGFETENDIYSVSDDEFNPSIKSPNCTYELPFYQTKESMMDIEVYRNFLQNAISRFRKSQTYKQYKGYLMDLGLNHCQVLSNIDEDLATIEMHHNFLTIYDIALMITEHVLQTIGYISTFDLVQLLKEEHKNNRIPIVMLSKTVHQMYHNNENFIIPANMCFGYWQELLIRYNKGITLDIANKCVMFIEKSLEIEQLGGNINYSNNLLCLRNNIINYAQYNTCGTPMIMDSSSYLEY